MPYPYNVPQPANLSEARALILAHPADARAHLIALDLAGPDVPVGIARGQLAVAAWLDPTNPAIRDRYAEALARDGDGAAALRQITLSVRNSPSLGTHRYLDARLLPWLSAAEIGAVTKGFKEAVAGGLSGAVEGFGSFYEAINRPGDAAALYASAAREAASAERKEGFLLLAGQAEEAAGAAGAAIGFFNEAAALVPADARPYADLVSLVYGPRKQWAEAEAAVARACATARTARRFTCALCATSGAMDGRSGVRPWRRSSRRSVRARPTRAC